MSPAIVPLFEIYVITAIGSPAIKTLTEEALNQANPHPTTIAELRHARDAFERELAISLRVKASTLESINLGPDEDPCTLKIANNLPSDDYTTLVQLLTEYQNVVEIFLADAWKSDGTTGVSNQGN